LGNRDWERRRDRKTLTAPKRYSGLHAGYGLFIVIILLAPSLKWGSREIVTVLFGTHSHVILEFEYRIISHRNFTEVCSLRTLQSTYTVTTGIGRVDGGSPVQNE
jgi:hypothetical protein